MRLHSSRTRSNLRESIFFREFFLRSWWVILFVIFCVIAYDQAIQSHHREYRRLEGDYFRLQENLLGLEAGNMELELQIQSQDDPSWIELTLMKVLGMVPENYQKVYFESD